MKIFGDQRSGNCLKVKYTADHLGLDYEWVPVDVMTGETRTPAFLERHPMGQAPAVQFADGRCLSQSNAIIRYLATGSPLLPDDAFLAAKVDEMLFWEQYSHEPYVAVCRFHVLYEGRPVADREAWRVERGEQALDFLERTLTGRDWLVGDHVSIADVSLLAYTAMAGDGGFDLEPRPRVRQWIARSRDALGIGRP